MSESSRVGSFDDLGLRRELLLVTQVALLGEVSRELRAVTVGGDGKTITLRAVFDRPISEDDRESIQCVGSEIVASFPAHMLDDEALRLDAPKDFSSLMLLAWVYIRKERDPLLP